MKTRDLNHSPAPLRALVLLIGSSLPLTATAGAILNSPERIFGLSIEELLAVNVSVASRSSLSLSEAPASVSVYSAKELKNMGISHLDELLNYIPGFMTARNDQARLNTATIRGRRVNNYNPDLLVLLNGIRMNDPVTGGGLFNISRFNLNHVRQIEVIRGPGSALYGSNAFSGVINIITDNSSNRLHASVGSIGHSDGQLQFEQGLGQWRLSGFIRSNQDKGQDYPPLLDYFGRFEPMTDAQYGEDAQLNLSYQGLSLNIGWNQRTYFGFVQGGAPSEVNQFDRSNHTFTLKYQHQFNQRLSTDFFAEDFNSSQQELLLIYPAITAAELPLGWTDGSQLDLIGGNRRAAGANRYGFNGSWLNSATHQFQFGLLGKRMYTSLNPFQGNYDAQLLEQSNGTVNVPSTSGIQQGFWLDGQRLDLLLPYERDVLGAYIQSQWQLNQRSTLTTGIRYDNYQDVGDNLSLRAALVYNLDASQNLKLLYGEAFRAPSILDTNALSSTSVVGNPELQPERVKTIDLIWQKHWPKLLFSVNLYFSRIEDEIVVSSQQLYEGFNSLQPTNQGHKHQSGVEFELQANITDHLHIKAGGAWFNHHQTVGTAKTTAFVSLSLDRQQWHWNINGHYHSQVLSRQADEQQFNNNIYLNGFVKFNSKLRYRLYDDIDIALTVSNLLDQDSYTYSSSASLEHGLPERGRQWRLGVDWYF